MASMIFWGVIKGNLCSAVERSSAENMGFLQCNGLFVVDIVVDSVDGWVLNVGKLYLLPTYMFMSHLVLLALQFTCFHLFIWFYSTQLGKHTGVQKIWGSCNGILLVQHKCN